MGAGKISAVAVFLLSFSILPGSVQAKYSGGSGEPNNPYKIANVVDLLALAGDVNDYSKCFILTADISLASNVFTTAVIACNPPPPSRIFYGIAFTGVFDGGGHKITNLTIDTNGVGDCYLGLFGYVSGGEIKNLGLKNVSITGADNSQYLGGLVGENAYGSISNCYSTGTVTGGTDSFLLGGLVGWNYGTISNCYSTCAVTGESGGRFGGLVGMNDGNISNCCSTGNIVAGGDGSRYLGGLVGYAYASTISSCCSTGTVTGDVNSHGLGGLVGQHEYSSTSNCYSTGAVTGGDNSYDLGGLVGENWNNISIINNCYSTGIVTGGNNSYNLGGLVGVNSGTISRCYFLVTSGPDNGLGAPLTDTQMKQQSSFVSWDFSTPVWKIHDDWCYPYLAWEKYSGGLGEPNYPYKIASVVDLLALAGDVNDYNKCFILTADINLASNSFTTAVIARDTDNWDWSFQGVVFTGVFDGAGHKISNLTINTSGAGNDFLGLFGYVSGGEIKNLGLENVAITGGYDSEYLGGLAGRNHGSNISNCYSTDTITGGDDSIYLGGLVGRNDDGAISNCYSTGAVTGGDESSGLGGLVGFSYGGTISNCYSTGAITGGYESCYLGGLMGGNGGNISNCRSTGDVAGGDYSRDLGGLVGFKIGGTISNCYSTGNVTGGDNSYDLGGLVGGNDGSITNCYSTGNVTGGGYLGGLVGWNGGFGTISNCYFLDTSGPNNGYGTPLTDEQMKIRSTFTDAGWDFENVWTICETTNYPRLLWQVTPAGDFVCPEGVNLIDYTYFANYWLATNCISPDNCGGTDLDRNGTVNWKDLAIFGGNWLEGL